MANLSYDPTGRLFQTSGGASGTTQFLYDGDALIAEYNGSGTLLRRYVHGPGLGEPLIWYEGASLTTQRTLRADHQGSIVSVADGAGGSVAINSYDEYGIPASSNLGRFQYTGQIMLPDLNFYHYKARIYSPTLGRFLQTDPIGYDDQVNLYAYVGNDPINHVDPDGQKVYALYSNTSQSLFIYDVESRRSAFVQANSGGKPAGDPIPSGSYSILERAGKEGFFRLEGRDSNFGDDEFRGRTELRLHGPGRTIGCISICTDKEAARVGSILNDTKTTEASVKSYWGSIGIRIDQGKREIVKNYGQLRALPAGVSLRMDSKTGVVSLTYREPGSRINRTVRICTMSKDVCE